MNAYALNSKYLIKRALKEFISQPKYTVITVMALSILTAVTMFFTTLATYSSERVIANALEDGQIAMAYQYVADDPVGYGADGNSVFARIIDDEDIDGITIYRDDNGVDFFGIIESSDELLALGYEFEGDYLPLENYNDFYCPDLRLDRYGYGNAEIGDEISFGDYAFILKGIIKTDYEKYYTLEYDSSINVADVNLKDDITDREAKIAEYYLSVVYDVYFCKSGIRNIEDDYISYIINLYETLTRENTEGDKKTFTMHPYSLKFDSGDYMGLVDDGSYLYFRSWTNNYVMTKDGLLEKTETTFIEDESGNETVVMGVTLPVADDEVIISQAVYNILFNENYVVAKDAELPAHLGETISFTLMDGDKELVTISDKKLVGVSAKSLNNESFSEVIQIVTTDLQEIQPYSNTVYGKIFKVDGNMEKNLTQWRKDGIMFSGYFAEAAYQRERDFKQITSFAGIASAALAALSVVAVVCFVSLRIRESKKEIGIMRSMGVSQKELYIIFLGGTLLSAIIAFIIAHICIAVAIPVINAICADEIFTELKFLTFTFLSELSGIGVGLLLPMICAIIPTARIISRPPVTLLRV